MTNSLCEHSTDKSQGLEVKLWCNILNSPCMFYRFCMARHQVIMLENYKTCKLRGDQMANRGRPRKTHIETTASPPPIAEKTKKIDSKTKKQVCNVLYKTDKKFAINFNDCGISINDPSPTKSFLVEIFYEGEFGTKNFKILSHKFI
jgi:hypothetical protein